MNTSLAPRPANETAETRCNVRHGDLGPPAHTIVLVAATAVFAVLGAVVSHRVPGWLLSTAFGALMLAVAVFTTTRAMGRALR